MSCTTAERFKSVCEISEYPGEGCDWGRFHYGKICLLQSFSLIHWYVYTAKCPSQCPRAQGDTLKLLFFFFQPTVQNPNLSNLESHKTETCSKSSHLGNGNHDILGFFWNALSIVKKSDLISPKNTSQLRVRAHQNIRTLTWISSIQTWGAVRVLAVRFVPGDETVTASGASVVKKNGRSGINKVLQSLLLATTSTSTEIYCCPCYCIWPVRSHLENRPKYRLKMQVETFYLPFF